MMILLVDEWELDGDTTIAAVIMSLRSWRGDEQPVSMEEGVNRTASPPSPAASSPAGLTLTAWFIASVSGEVGPSQMMLDESEGRTMGSMIADGDPMEGVIPGQMQSSSESSSSA